MKRKPPLLLRSRLTGRVYIVTSYVDGANGVIEARTKYDVTDQYDALVSEASQEQPSDSVTPATVGNAQSEPSAPAVPEP